MAMYKETRKQWTFGMLHSIYRFRLISQKGTEKPA